LVPWRRGGGVALAMREELLVGFSDDRRFFVSVLVLFVFFVLVIIIGGVSGRHVAVLEHDEAPNVLGNAWIHFGSCVMSRNSRTMLTRVLRPAKRLHRCSSLWPPVTRILGVRNVGGLSWRQVPAIPDGVSVGPNVTRLLEPTVCAAET